MDNRSQQIDLFRDWLTSQSVHLSIWAFLINLALAIALAFLLGRVYIRYGRSLSNRRVFSHIFWPLAAATMLIITIVKSSLALSLGLVGALSIVRFRSAIKEPEELLYLFFAIAIGLGFGADQGTITIAAMLCVMGLIIAFSYRRRSDDAKNLLIAITSKSPGALSLADMSDTLKKHCAVVHMKRFDETDELLEASFLVEIDRFEQLNAARLELRQRDSAAKITFLDNKGVF